MSDGLIHVMPINDIDYHHEDIVCPCNPMQTAFGVLIHNAFDGRDIKELEAELKELNK